MYICEGNIADHQKIDIMTLIVQELFNHFETIKLTVKELKANGTKVSRRNVRDEFSSISGLSATDAMTVVNEFIRQNKK